MIITKYNSFFKNYIIDELLNDNQLLLYVNVTVNCLRWVCLAAM